jgi:hypothetical protein
MSTTEISDLKNNLHYPILNQLEEEIKTQLEAIDENEDRLTREISVLQDQKNEIVYKYQNIKNIKKIQNATKFFYVVKSLESEKMMKLKNIYSFGANEYCQLGNKVLECTNVPTLITSFNQFDEVIDIVCGMDFTHLITGIFLLKKVNSEIISFGENKNDCLGPIQKEVKKKNKKKERISKKLIFQNNENQKSKIRKRPYISINRYTFSLLKKKEIIMFMDMDPINMDN